MIFHEKTTTEDFKVGLVCVGGGHLTEILQILESVKDKKKFLVTYPAPNTPAELIKIFDSVYTVNKLYSNMFEAFLSFLKIVVIIFKEKPKIIISTGSEIAIPFFYLSKLFFGTKLIYIECSAQVYTPSLTGKIVYPVADLFLVQWAHLLKKYGKKAKYVGRLI